MTHVVSDRSSSLWNGIPCALFMTHVFLCGRGGGGEGVFSVCFLVFWTPLFSRGGGLQTEHVLLVHSRDGNVKVVVGHNMANLSK